MATGEDTMVVLNGSYTAQLPGPGAAFAEALRRAGVPHLEDVRLRWDAAERCLVVMAPDGRETRLR